jgi:serine/threonine protein kinase
MTRVRWTEIEPLLSAALIREPHERAAFLADACGGNLELQQEVESLLAGDAAADGFLTVPAIASARDLLEHPAVGRRIGPYTLVAPLGAGGMGEVYRARDGQLERDVAIKMLPPAFAHDRERLARFEREARILAALNHPHIGAIYGLENADGAPALVLELIEGPTLAQRLAPGPLPVADAVAIAAVIAEALDAAHTRGIIHRDLTPANIKVTGDRSVKILDFGVAKGLKDNEDARVDDGIRAPTHTSSPGAIIGTPAYMSPEQARGELVDERTDLFSLGVVLHEMVTGRPPLQSAKAPSDLSPPSSRARSTDLPPALDRLIAKLLTNERDARYQTAADVHRELTRILGTFEPRVPPVRGVSWRGALAAGAVAVIVTAWISWASSSTRATRVHASTTEYTQITHFADSATSPALSHDGRMLTFIRGESTFEDLGRIYVKRLPDGEPEPLTSDASAKMSPVFSSDSTQIAYTSVDGNFLWDTWVVSLRDREPRLWLPNASGLSWLPGGRIMFSEIATGLHMSVLTADERRRATRPVYSPAHERGMAHRSYASPDGAWVLISEMDSTVWQRCRIVPFDGSSAGRVVGPDGQCTSAAWSPDGGWMYFSSNSGGRFHLWRQRFPDGVPEPITRGPDEEEGIAPDPDGRSLLTSIGNRQSSIWMHDTRGEREVSREGFAFLPRLPNNGPSQPFSADGRSIFYLVRQGAVRFTGIGERSGELWTTDLATGRSRAVLPGFSVIGYDIARDGTQVAVAALDDRGRSHIWLAAIDGSTAPRLLADFAADSPRFGAPGSVFCRRAENGLSFIYRLEEGRVPVKAVSASVLFFLSASPDGSWLLARVQTQGSTNQVNLAFPSRGGPPTLLCDTCEIDWTPNARSLIIRLRHEDLSEPSRTFIVALSSGEMLPPLPAHGIRSTADLKTLRVIGDEEGLVYPADAIPSYAVVRERTERNIYRIPLP